LKHTVITPYEERRRKAKRRHDISIIVQTVILTVLLCYLFAENC